MKSLLQGVTFSSSYLEKIIYIGKYCSYRLQNKDYIIYHMQDVHSLMKMKIVLARVTVYRTLGKCSEGFICINPLVSLSKLMLLVKNNGAKC